MFRPPAGRPFLSRPFARVLRRWAAPAAVAAACGGPGFCAPAAFAQFGEEAANPLLVEPEAPAELVTAAARLRRIGRPNLAKRYLRSLLDSNPGDAELLAARDVVGPATFFELAADPDLRPESATLQRRVDEAFARRSTDPAALNATIDALVGGPRQREAAEVTLRGLADLAAPRLVERLAAASGPTGDRRFVGPVTRVLGEIAGDAVPPLTAVLRDRAASPAARAAAAAALGRTGADGAALPLLGPAFDRSEAPAVRQAAAGAAADLLGVSPGELARVAGGTAADRLARRADELLRETVRAEDGGGTADPLFRYDATENRLTPVVVSADAAGRYEAAALASAAARLAPNRDDLRATELAAALAYEQALAGRGAFVPTGPGTVHRSALSAGLRRVLDALDLSLDAGADDAAAAALQVLLSSPSAAVLDGTRGVSPVVRALASPAPEVRFLAALVAARAGADAGFTAGPRVVDVFTAALAAAPGGRALVIDPDGRRATRMAGLLQSAGYVVELADTAREGFALAGTGLNLVAVHANVRDLPVSQFAANLRADARTRQTPLVVYGDARLEPAVSRIADRNEPAAFVAFPNDPEIVARRLADLGGRPPLPDDLKVEQKRAAARELARLADRRDDVFPLRDAVDALAAATADPATVADAAAALSAVPSREAQTALATALLVVRPDGGMVPAAVALTDSVRRFGSLLDANTVAALRDLSADAGGDEVLRDALLALAAALPGGADVLPVAVELPAG